MSLLDLPRQQELSPVKLSCLALLPTDSTETIEEDLLDFFCTLIPRIDAIWEARKQAKYVEAVENSAGANPIYLRALQRKYKPYTPRPIKEPKNVVYGVRLGYAPGKYLYLLE